tara:strand:- start:193 stop:1233 length:1041 start_codon:yes stop_codon:yes gene_type:complete
MAAFISFQPNKFVNSSLYTGNSSSAEIPVTGVGFQPDLVWAKNRDATYDHFLFDSVRGATKYVKSNSTAAEATNAQTLKSFDSDGYTMGTDSDVNQSTSGFASWSWKAGTSTGLDLTAGTITPSAYSISTTAGISILQYTGTGTASQTIAHGLGAVPKFMIFKRTDGTSQWPVYNVGTGNTKCLFLESSAATDTSTTYFQDTTPTDTLISIGSGGDLNTAASTNICYCFAEKTGFSHFGWYYGQADMDGPMIFTGFRPAVLIVKIGAISAWVIQDDKRLGYNPTNNYLIPSTSAVEGTNFGVDFCANGFKIRDDDSDVNHNGGTMTYAAFAEWPLVSSNDTPGVAR